MYQTNQNQFTTNEDSRWKSLYKIGGAAALIIVLSMLIHSVVLGTNPPPDTVIDWFTLFQRNKLVGLIDFDLLYVVDNALMIVVYLAFYAALRRAGETLMIIATALGLVAIATFFSSNTAFSMLSLSNQYAAAASEAQKSMLLAAGQAMLSTYNGTSFIVFTVLGSIAPILISVVMLQSNIFSKTTAYMGIIGNMLPFGLFLPAIGIYFGLASLPFLLIWFILVALRFFQYKFNI